MRFSRPKNFFEGQEGIAAGVGFEAFGEALVGVFVSMILCGALAEAPGPFSGIAASVFSAPRGEAGFGNQFVQGRGVVEHLFDVPRCEAEWIIARRQIALGQQALLQIRVGLNAQEEH